jgi:hypothetical protein
LFRQIVLDTNFLPFRLDFVVFWYSENYVIENWQKETCSETYASPVLL